MLKPVQIAYIFSQKKCRQLLGEAAHSDTPPGVLPMNPTGGTATDPHCYPLTLNDLLPYSVYKAYSAWLHVVSCGNVVQA